MVPVLGYLSLYLGIAAALFGMYELVRFAVFALRKENHVRVKIWGIPGAIIKDEARFNVVFSRVAKAVVCFAVLTAVGAYLLGLPVTINGNKVQGGP